MRKITIKPLGKKKKKTSLLLWNIFEGYLFLSSEIVRFNDIKVRLNSLMNLHIQYDPCVIQPPTQHFHRAPTLSLWRIIGSALSRAVITQDIITIFYSVLPLLVWCTMGYYAVYFHSNSVECLSIKKRQMFFGLPVGSAQQKRRFQLCICSLLTTFHLFCTVQSCIFESTDCKYNPGTTQTQQAQCCLTGVKGT